ncbi:Holliday junction branch migration protein RuvA [Clostridium sp. 'White wine YQ']|uniref:Holliday junction branch migration protein RuvA n=1 Tax=Clostridium sp. 'White wine YQ' TaxID=3027474 RepID=UPI002365F8F1|nr:Holliday junction branch migration protein RuvA [Clostridium sp. 'White wine YQ']MDD7794058.1 Holliday junction branch migration protein RuvA [Clostridium sp. 'White wine YQ']
MYEYIKGIYKGFNKEYIIIDNGGIGYKIYTSGTTIAKLPKIEDEVLIYIQQIVREDFIGLYGFITREELEMFNILLTINGVGAKAALSLLSISSVNNLKYAIMTEDEKHIVRAPGIGKKTAQRIILELKDKLKSDELIEKEADISINDDYANNINEALTALVALGYSEKEAKGAISLVNKEQTIENIIKDCLRNLMR